MARILAALLLLVAACMPGGEAQSVARSDPACGEIAARPGQGGGGSAETGLRRLGAGPRAAFLYVPKGSRAEKPAPFVLMLHGAGGSGQRTIDTVTAEAERLGLIVLAPSSSAASWDIISSRRYGPDVAAIDDALSKIFAEYEVDPERVAVGGFSDGASYALSLGLANGGLFRRVIAFSPGFMSPSRAEGQPLIFISHGVADRVLPIDICSRRIVPLLKSGGYEVDYVEFQGGHTVPPEIARRAYDVLADQAADRR